MTFEHFLFLAVELYKTQKEKLQNISWNDLHYTNNMHLTGIMDVPKEIEMPSVKGWNKEINLLLKSYSNIVTWQVIHLTCW